MRVADTTRMDLLLRGLGGAQVRYTDAAREASTGSRIPAPSSDPVAAAQLARTQGAVERTGAYRSTIRTVRGDLEMSESTLASAQDLVQQAHDLALRGSAGSLGPDERAAMATEVGQLRDQLFALANQKGTQGYLFGGTQTTSAPFSETDPTFTGNDNPRNVEISPGVVSATNVSGGKAFAGTGGGRDVFADLEALRVALSSGDVSGVGASVNSLDTSHRQILAARSDAGLLLERFDTAEAAHDETDLALRSQTHALADTNPAQAYARLSQLQQNLEDSISVARTMLSSLATAWFS